ncbi:hypothetical protein E2C01_076265 [Portunus trituberculatus]|uniref:Uncharacterized protein n=1 Tax=Portunus trituberculatus TaxID=210409 RepID=A0A5B7IJD5_PORTR|nr:hypothetical protein [Portunus trituberculatus]
MRSHISLPTHHHHHQCKGHSRMWVEEQRVTVEHGWGEGGVGQAASLRKNSGLTTVVLQGVGGA